MLLDADPARRARIDAVGYDYAAVDKEAVEACNLCGSRNLVTIAERDRYGFPAATSACTRCSLAFLDPRPTSAAYTVFYDRFYRPLVSAYHGRLIDARTVEADQVGYAQALVEFLEPHAAHREGQRVLDIGGSTGVIAEALERAYRLRPLVVDPAAAEVARARERGLDARVGAMETFETDERFEVVVLCQTVDHLLDVRSSLESVRRLIADDGIFFVDIVDFRSAYLRAGSVEEATKIDHPYSFTQATIEAYLERAGFGVAAKRAAADGLHVEYVCSPSDPADVLPEPVVVQALLAEIAALAETV